MTQSEPGRPIGLVVLPANRRGALYGKLDPATHAIRRGVLDELERQGFAVEFLDVNTSPRNPLAGRHSLLAAIDPWRALTVLLARRRARIVLCYFESGSFLIALLRKFLFFRGKIVVVDIGVDETWRLRRLLLRLVIPRLDAIFTFGSVQVDYIRKNYRTKAQVRFLPQWVDVDFYRPGTAEPEDYILSVGDDRSRDFGTLLRAVAGTDVPVVLKTRQVADGDPALSPSVTILRQRLSDLEFRSLYARARVVVLSLHTTLHAGGVTTLLEAMSVGRPIIVSDSIGLRDYLRHEENCLVVPCEDDQALRAAITRLLADPAECARLGQGARRFIERECSRQIHAGRLGAAFRELISVDTEPKLAENPV